LCEFEPPIAIERGRTLLTLKDAGEYLAALAARSRLAEDGRPGLCADRFARASAGLFQCPDLIFELSQFALNKVLNS
jgi:hypothetical protein